MRPPGDRVVPSKVAFPIYKRALKHGIKAIAVHKAVPPRRCAVEAAYWAALEEATSPADGEARLRRLVTDLEHSYPSAAACLAEDLPALCVTSSTRSASAGGCARRTCWRARWRRSSGGRR